MGRSQFSLSRMARPWLLKGLSSKSNSTTFPLQSGEETIVPTPKTGELKDAGKKLEEELVRAAIPIEERMASGDNRMWDLELSSMSSCASHDLKISSLDISGLDCCDNAASRRIEASCSEIEEEQDQVREAAQSIHDHEEKTITKITKQRRRNYSISAALPLDLEGPARCSVPLVLESSNPFRDFRDSMAEMVRENGIFEWHDLQELLYSFISLNSSEQHDSIKQAFVDVMLELHLDNELEFFLV